MTDEKPTSEQDAIAAALAALSNAAAPTREDVAPEEAAPPPPPAPESTEAQDYPPPTGEPVSAGTASTTAVVPPAPTSKRKRWPWILALCIVAGVLLLGGIAACASSAMNVAFHAIQHNERPYDYDDLFNRDVQDGLMNYYFAGMDSTFNELLVHFNVEEGTLTENGAYARGGYHVGGENGIAPGLYYLEGSQSGVSNYYVFSAMDDSDDPSYGFRLAGEYFGNYYVLLEEGDAIMFIPFEANETMFLAPDAPMDVMPPYESGCYRVGIDIPAGTYTITCDAEAARETDSEAGAYVMKDLAFEDDAIVESVFVIKGGRQTITVENGEYLELFATIATPATASTKVPLQPAESEMHHAA